MCIHFCDVPFIIIFTNSSLWPPSPCQIKDILKGALRFNQSQLEAEENEEITIADDHYTSTAAAGETVLSTSSLHSGQQQQANIRPSRDSELEGSASMDEKEEQQAMTPFDQQVSVFPVCVNYCSVPLPAVLASNTV